jgi:hypothetical protein
MLVYAAVTNIAKSDPMRIDKSRSRSEECVHFAGKGLASGRMTMKDSPQLKSEPQRYPESLHAGKNWISGVLQLVRVICKYAQHHCHQWDDPHGITKRHTNR